ncbi:MAG: hypothetical protein LAT80_12895 [Balneolaceae bacterium]|nr:hypothetical protein [Balneolaceae bacterium]
MTLIINEHIETRELAPSGLQAAVCVDAVDIGTHETPWGEKQKVMLIFELEAVDSKGDRFLLQKRYTKSLNEKSNLRKDLERWRGRPFNPRILKEGFNLENVVGIPAMLYIEHRETEKGIWANVDSILPAPDRPLVPSGNYKRAATTDENT